jgi:cytidine deaminase
MNARAPLHPDTAEALLVSARKAAQACYAPYSRFPVGAALLCETGEVITGANVENGSYGLTLCAERVALAKAVTDGYHQFQAMAVWAGEAPGGAITPCGACRQFMAEFLKPDTPVIFADPRTGHTFLTMAELLPAPFARPV